MIKFVKDFDCVNFGLRIDKYKAGQEVATFVLGYFNAEKMITERMGNIAIENGYAVDTSEQNLFEKPKKNEYEKKITKPKKTKKKKKSKKWLIIT